MNNININKILQYIILIVIFFLILNFASTILSYKHLPGPVYGGDVYRDRGFIESINQGFKPWEDGYFLNEHQYYNWFGSALLSIPVSIFNFPIESTMLWFSFLVYIAIIVAYYFIADALFKKKLLSCTSALIAAVIFIYPSVKFSKFGSLLLILFILFFIKFIQTKENKYHLYAGITLAICGLTYGAVYAAAMIFYALWLLFELIKRIKFDFKEKLKLKKVIKDYFYLILPFLIALLIPLIIHYLPLMLRYAGNAPNPVYEYGDTSIKNFTLGTVLLNEVKLFFNFSNIFKFAFGLAAVIGLIFIFISKNKFSVFLKKFYLYNFVAKLHHYISKPLLGKWFFPHKMSLTHYVFPIFIMNTVNSVFVYLKKRKQIFAFIFIFCIIVLSIGYGIFKINNFNDSKWVKYGKQMDQSTQMIYDAGEYLKTHMSNDETVLANDETSFALMALSGKKVVVSRRTHASYYVDIDKRIADIAIILYSNNNALRNSLLNKYKVKYFFEDSFIYNNPMNTRIEFVDYLKENNINFQIADITLDPAQTPEAGTVETRAIIIPGNLSQGFREIIKPIKAFTIEGNTAAVLYEVNAPTSENLFMDMLK